MKRILSVLIAAAMLTGIIFTGIMTAQAETVMPFRDVKHGNWFYDAVLYVFERELMNGTASDTFAPNGKLTRAMFITVLGRMAGAEQTDSYVFPDVKNGTWYSGYVGWAVSAGVVTGFPDGTFKPNDNLTREQMAAAISRYIEYKAINLPRENTAPYEFSDSSKIASWAGGYVEVLRRAGIVNGDSNGKYNPKANLSRAEMATIIMNLISSFEKAWQGYIPSPDDDEIVLGARYLYYSGTLVSGGLATELDGQSKPYPSLYAYYDGTAASRTYLPSDTFGISFSVLGQTYADYPYAVVSYSYENSENDIPAAGLYCAGTSLGDATLTGLSETNGVHSVLIDLSSLLEANPGIDDGTRFTQLLFRPFGENDGADSRFSVQYIALFRTENDARSFDPSKYSGYLEGYYLYSPVTMSEIDDETTEYYESLLQTRIREIKNSGPEVTPDDIKAQGGTCYYISSVHGNDSNDGKSPETAWASPIKLWKILAGGQVWLPVPAKGDGVFFECGSEFYSDDEYQYTAQYYGKGTPALYLSSGITYSSYGEGDKPFFTSALDFRDSDRTGVWNETEWENIYVTDDRYCGQLTRDTGILIFNKGEGVGIRMVPDDTSDPFGEGKTVIDKGLCCNGYEYYDTGVKSCESPGTALTNDLEFIYDPVGCKVYLYCEGGDPSERFDEIMLAPCRAVVKGDGLDSVRVDNFTVMYSGDQLLSIGDNNITISNCEVGYCVGSLSSIEHSLGVYAGVDNYVIRNCYSHDIGDGAITNQCGSSLDADKAVLNHVTYENNVLITSGIGFEVWAHMGTIKEDGSATQTIENFTIKDNIVAYTGYGMTNKQAGQAMTDPNALAMIDSSMYGEFHNCIIEGNTFFNCSGVLLRAYAATDSQELGWNMRDNTYIMSRKFNNMTYMYETMPYLLNHNMNKRHRMSTPYDQRYLTFWTANGFDPTGTYYYYESDNRFGAIGAYFTDAYYVERGIIPAK